MGTSEGSVKLALDKDFWEGRYQCNETGWDIGHCSFPLEAYFNQLQNKDLSILIPGCGNAYEAEHLHALGFTNVFLIDLAPSALENFKKRVPSFPKEHLIQGDFFELNQTFDLLIEQTFFCALNPNLRSRYAEKCAALLSENGRLVGLMFDDPLNSDHPPFGGSKEEYINYFNPYFDIEIMELATNSIEPRKGRELFIKLIKK